VITEKKTAAHISVDPVILQTIEAHSKPGDYILTAESPIVCVLANRQNALGVCGLNDAILPYIKGTPLQIETLRGSLEEKLPKVFVFGTNVQIQQKAFHRVLFDPFLAEHHYVRVNDLLWYLPGEN
jgi:hypothetical protein